MITLPICMIGLFGGSYYVYNNYIINNQINDNYINDCLTNNG